MYSVHLLRWLRNEEPLGVLVCHGEALEASVCGWHHQFVASPSALGVLALRFSRVSFMFQQEGENWVALGKTLPREATALLPYMTPCVVGSALSWVVLNKREGLGVGWFGMSGLVVFKQKGSLTRC